MSGLSSISIVDTPVLASSGGAIVDVDITLFIQAGVFLVLLIVLRYVLFKPILKLLVEREKRIDGAREEARLLEEENSKRIAEYEGKLSEARRTAAERRQLLKNEAQQTEQELLMTVKTEATRELDEARLEIKKSAQTAAQELQKQADQLGLELAQRIIGRRI